MISRCSRRVRDRRGAVLSRRARPAGVRARRGVPARPLPRGEGGRASMDHPGRRPHGADQPARDRDGRAGAGGDHARQRLAEGERGALLPRAAPGEGGDPGRELPLRHLADRADHAAQRVRPGRDLDELLAEREQINQKLQEIIDHQTEPWGVKVRAVEVKQIDLPVEMQRAMARQAEAEREKRTQGDPRRGRVPGRAAPRRRGARARVGGVGAPAALPADAHRDRHREQLDHAVPDPDRHPAAVLRDGAQERIRRKSADRGAKATRTSSTDRARAPLGGAHARQPVARDWCCSACSAVWLSLGAFTLEPGQAAVLLRLGKHVRTVTEPGFHLTCRRRS